VNRDSACAAIRTAALHLIASLAVATDRVVRLSSPSGRVNV
jgi:hypothetical protein